MVIYRFRHEDLLRTRFAISPLYELLQSVAALREPARAAIHLPWLRAARRRVADLDLALLEALVPRDRYQPDFATPPPQTPLPDLASELDRVRRAPAARVRAEIATAYDGTAIPAVLAPLLERPRPALRALAELMAQYWARALEPSWEAIRGALEDDIAYRARLLTTAGAEDVFADLHPDARWCEDRLEVRRPYDQEVDLAGRGLLLVPSAFVWPRSAVLVDPPWQPMVVYPARGLGELWAPERRDPRALGDLLGPRRAAILAGLDRETSTTAIARRLGASPAGVSEHLSVLRRAGLVRPRRQGREVLYGRTASGDALLRAGA